MSIKTKFKVHQILDGLTGRDILMSPVSSDKPKHVNKSLWESNPIGSISLKITNKDAKDEFEAGKEYYVEFSKAK
jgi:hypothetical protein